MSTRPDPQPLDPPMTPFAVAGLVLWALAGLATVLFDGPAGWAKICLAGVVVGIPGLLTMIVHDRGWRHRTGGGYSSS